MGNWGANSDSPGWIAKVGFAGAAGNPSNSEVWVATVPVLSRLLSPLASFASNLAAGWPLKSGEPVFIQLDLNSTAIME